MNVIKNYRLNQRFTLLLHYVCAYLALFVKSFTLPLFIINVVTYTLLLSSRSKQNKPFSRRSKLACYAVIALSIVCFVLTIKAPVQAGIFDQAQTFLETCFTPVSGLISFIFNLIRFLLLIYLGISLVTGIQAVRDGQSLTPVATPPLVVIAIVIVVDVTTTLVISGSTCNLGIGGTTTP